MASLEAAWLERTWVDLKQNKWLYGVNKTLSIVVAAALALITIWIRSTAGKEQTPCATEDYKFLFWMLFVFYSFQALCEMYESFLAYNQISEKGVVGLLFELNYFCGIYTTLKVAKAVFRSP